VKGKDGRSVPGDLRKKTGSQVSQTALDACEEVREEEGTEKKNLRKKRPLELPDNQERPREGSKQYRWDKRKV